MLSAFAEKGYSMFWFMEIDWTPHIDALQDLPEAKVIGLFEFGDLRNFKDRIGHKIKIAGGMPINILKYKNKEECVDYAKKVIDTLAPGGEYVFTVDRAMLAENDCKAENLIAVNEFVRDYAVY